MRNVALQGGVLQRQRHQLGMATARKDRLAPGGNGRERGRQVQLLERTGPEHLSADLTGQSQYGRAVHFGVVKAGQQIRRTWSGDGETGGRFAGQFAIRLDRLSVRRFGGW